MPLLQPAGITQQPSYAELPYQHDQQQRSLVYVPLAGLTALHMSGTVHACMPASRARWRCPSLRPHTFALSIKSYRNPLAG
jgi:hypothetical protein